MRPAALGATILLLAMLLPHTARAQDESEFERSTRAQRYATFDISPVDEVARTGGQSLRVYVYGAFSGLLPVIVLDRKSHGPGRLTVISGARRGGLWTRVVHTTLLSDAVWSKLFADGLKAAEDWQALDRPDPHASAVGPGTGPVGAIYVCADGQTSIVEVAVGGRAIHASEHDCEFTELGDLAKTLAAQAVTSIPGCGAIVQQQRYGDLTRLLVCGYISGDQRPATEVLNGVSARHLVAQAAPNIVVDWPGAPRIAGKEAFDRLWARLGTSNAAHFQLDEVHGVNAHRVLVRGWMYSLINADDAEHQRAPCRETWERVGGAWRLVRLTVGVFTPAVLAHDPRSPS